MPLQIETRTNGAIAILRGPLNFAVELSFDQTTTIGLRYGSMIKYRKSSFKSFKECTGPWRCKATFPWCPCTVLDNCMHTDTFGFSFLLHISCRLTITLKTTPFFPLTPGSSQLIHWLSWFKIQLSFSSRPTGENYLFKYGKPTVSLSRWRQKHARSSGDWIWIRQPHHLWVLPRVSRMELWTKWGLFHLLQPS